jgi:hypothetical protein
MMQDRVFQLMQLLHHDVTGDFSTSLTNQFIGIDVVLNDSSISSYEYMGFNVKSMTQDVSGTIYDNHRKSYSTDALQR